VRTLYKAYITQVGRFETRATKIQDQITTVSVWEQRYLCETLLSDCWQAWNDFCRNILHLSCKGGVCRSGAAIAPRLGVNSWQRLGFEAKNARPPPLSLNATKTISFLRQEPTWGDQNKIIDVITTLGPANTANLLVAFGLPLLGPKHLQIVRNACFHKNSETVQAVKVISSSYGNGVGVSGPADLIWCYEPSKGTNAIYSWLADFKTIAEVATENV
jgi:hypothetical protein